MKQFVVTFSIAVCCAMTVNAQSFLDRLQKQGKSQGKVTVTQNAAIDELVNGPKTSIAKPTTKPPTAETKPSTTTPKQATTTTTQPKPSENTEKSNDTANEMEIPTVDMRKKVMSKSYKVNGYRVQAFAGGNTRSDRQKAEQIGNDIKYNFPDEPIYVHFYSPRWICRVGNYRTYEEAHKMLLEIRKLGYKQSSIVKGKISVQY